MPRWFFTVEGTTHFVEAITTDGAKRNAQIYIDDAYGFGKYVATIVQQSRQQPKLVVTKVVKPTAPAGHKIWEYAVLVSKGTRDELYVHDTVTAAHPLTAAAKAQAEIDQKYGPGRYKVSVGMNGKRRAVLTVEVLG